MVQIYGDVVLACKINDKEYFFRFKDDHISSCKRDELTDDKLVNDQRASEALELIFTCHLSNQETATPQVKNSYFSTRNKMLVATYILGSLLFARAVSGIMLSNLSNANKTIAAVASFISLVVISIVHCCYISTKYNGVQVSPYGHEPSK